MKITAINGKFTSKLSLPGHPFIIRDELDKLRAGDDTQLKIKITDCDEVGALEGMQLTAALWKMNVFAERIDQLDLNSTSKPDIQIAALLKVKPQRTIDELIRMTYSDGIPVYHCKDFAELGAVVIDNDMLSELEDVPENLLPILDKAWVGRTYAEREGGIFVEGYYCESAAYEEPDISVTVGRRDDVFSITLVPPGKDPEICGQNFRLPVNPDDLEKFSAESGVPLDDLNYYSLNCSIPVRYEPQSPMALNALANLVSKLEGYEVVKLKAILQTLPSHSIQEVWDITMHLDEYDLDRSVRSYDEFGQKYLQKLLPPDFSESALDDTDLTDLGCNVLFMKGGTITTYGALSGKGQQLYTAVVDEVIEETEDESEDENMGVIMT
ncbi:hypothetical protein SAMN02910447_03077 [Ruminococcus sp. YE71]|uniref:hypothetical protein n=1 Tax=unclassified Ruminococcus TaxID=2608920 RepID=UPI000882AF25|nr:MULTISPECIES: hypothetical protein [unclassified Ruminococcus]SDA29580.1 hypothetical protein SAMN02910446_03149 [Ruminococcus sp. YE78]SFW48530.1 hypothetical protein SAMN02910447_03077 [Ruminococcus sp. YE71]